MKIFHTVLRVGLGLMLLVFGLNKFLWFMPDFKFDGFPEAKYLFDAMHFSGAAPTGKGYLLGLVGATEIFAGLLLVIKKWVPLALVVLMPVSVNIIFFHLFVYLNPVNLGPAFLVAGVNVYLMYLNWDSYKSLFS